MTILSHRGFWTNPSEKNQVVAFDNSFMLGFGTETDIRDYNGELVISHDVADEKCISVGSFFEIYTKINPYLPLALNIKADGLQEKLRVLLDEFNIENYFVFDMSVPDGLIYLRNKLKTFTRQSEYERQPSFYDEAIGIWLDEFKEHWIDEATILQHIKNGKRVCIVSPDLHKREYLKEWAEYKSIEQKFGLDLMICTDHPQLAKEFFKK